MRIAIIALFLGFTGLLASCSTTTQQVDIPIPVGARKPNVEPMPYLPIYDLSKTSSPANVIKAYVSSVELLKGDDEALRDVIG